VLSTLAAALRLASIGLCLIVGASFALFAIEQTSNASAHQRQKVDAAGERPSSAPNKQPDGGSASAKHSGEGSARKAIDEAAETVTSPFSAVTDGWSGEWSKRGVLLLLTLAIYGFGLGFIARIMRVRA
jgi:hypothetical protein